MKIASARALAALLFAPATALAFETVDTLPWPSLGTFPAYSVEEERPTRLWVQGGLMYDDNLLRRETGEEDDFVSRIGAGIRHEARIVGRQRVRLEARADYYMFDQFDQLDHLAYAGAADWFWEIGNDWSGTLGIARQRRLVDIAESQAPVRNLLTDTRASATASYRLGPSVRLNGGLASTRGDSSTRAESETRATAVSLGAGYVSRLGNSVGVEYRTAEGDAPVPELIAPLGTFVNNDYDEEEVALLVTYALGEQLRTALRLGHTTREYTELSGRDFDGTTGRAQVEWLPGTKTSLLFSAYREPRSILDVAASHQVVEGVSFGPRWAYSAKLVLSAQLLRERRIFEGDPAVVAGAEERNERIKGLRFGVGWEPRRNWQIGLSWDHGERESNIVNRDYEFDAYTLNVAWRY